MGGIIEFLAFGSLELRDPPRGPVERLLAQPKRTALLAYLAFARPRGFHRRDEVLAVFWPENETGSARNALSASLTFLRRELPEGLIVTRGAEEIGLDQDAVHSDVVAFEEAIARGDHRQAVIRGLRAIRATPVQRRGPKLRGCTRGYATQGFPTTSNE